MRAGFREDSSCGFMCCRLIGKSEQASASHISGAKSCETKGKPLVQIPLVSAHSVRRAKSLYVNISGAKQFLCNQCVQHTAPKGFFVWALVYSLWWWGRCREYGPPEWKLPGSHRSDPATSSQTPSPIYFVRTTTPAVPDRRQWAESEEPAFGI